MASHAGLVYVLRTKKGYVGPNKTYVNNIEEAEQIRFERFGWCDSSSVLEKLGFEKEEVYAETIVTTYEGRVDTLVDLYTTLGYDREEAELNATMNFKMKNLYNATNYMAFEDELKNRVKKLNEGTPIIETIITSDGVVILRELIKKRKSYKNEEYEQQRFYSQKGEGYKTTVRLKTLPVDKYFNCSAEETALLQSYQSDKEQIKKTIIDSLVENDFRLGSRFDVLDVKVKEDSLTCYTVGGYDIEKFLLSTIRDYYEQHAVHITRMFGSYILLTNESGSLKAIKATPIPIKYCPLMTKLLKEVGGSVADELLKTLTVEDEELQTTMMCKLINEVVIKGGYFDTNRPLNSCEANVLFGASETIASAFEAKLVDAAVIVSNNLGTIITTNASNTQGAVKRMTGLFYTSPSKEIMDAAGKAKIIPVFPHTANIDQIAGVKKAISLGYKRIAVSVAADDNYLHKQLKLLEIENDVTIYKFGLCSTGIDEQTATIMGNYADVVWSCASKHVKKHIEPAAIAQVGVKIPVHIMTKNGWILVKNHLQHMKHDFDLDSIELRSGDEKPIFLNEEDQIKVLTKKNVHNCSDCPHPCI